MCTQFEKKKWLLATLLKYIALTSHSCYAISRISFFSSIQFCDLCIYGTCDLDLINIFVECLPWHHCDTVPHFIQQYVCMYVPINNFSQDIYQHVYVIWVKTQLELAFFNRKHRSPLYHNIIFFSLYLQIESYTTLDMHCTDTYMLVCKYGMPCCVCYSEDWELITHQCSPQANSRHDETSLWSKHDERVYLGGAYGHIKAIWHFHIKEKSILKLIGPTCLMYAGENTASVPSTITWPEMSAKSATCTYYILHKVPYLAIKYCLYLSTYCRERFHQIMRLWLTWKTYSCYDSLSLSLSLSLWLATKLLTNGYTSIYQEGYHFLYIQHLHTQYIA